MRPAAFGLLILGAAVGGGCESRPVGTPAPAVSLLIGSGGGITGAHRRYRVEEDGAVYALGPDAKSARRVGTLGEDATRRTFRDLEALALASYDFDHPFDMTYSLGVERGGETHWVRWGDPAHAIREDVKAFHARVTRAIRALP